MKRSGLRSWHALCYRGFRRFGHFLRHPHRAWRLFDRHQDRELGCHEGSSWNSERSFDEASRSSQNALHSAGRRVSNEAYIACRVSHKQQLHNHSIWNDILPDLRSQQSAGHSFLGNDPYLVPISGRQHSPEASMVIRPDPESDPDSI